MTANEAKAFEITTPIFVYLILILSLSVYKPLWYVLFVVAYAVWLAARLVLPVVRAAIREEKEIERKWSYTLPEVPMYHTINYRTVVLVERQVQNGKK